MSYGHQVIPVKKVREVQTVLQELPVLRERMAHLVLQVSKEKKERQGCGLQACKAAAPRCVSDLSNILILGYKNKLLFMSAAIL